MIKFNSMIEMCDAFADKLNKENKKHYASLQLSDFGKEKWDAGVTLFFVKNKSIYGFGYFNELR